MFNIEQFTCRPVPCPGRRCPVERQPARSLVVRSCHLRFLIFAEFRNEINNHWYPCPYGNLDFFMDPIFYSNADPNPKNTKCGNEN